MNKNELMTKMARESFEKGGFNGTWLYAENGRIVTKGAVGWRDPENRLPMQEDTIFEMASITKQFTATAVMLLVRAGKLGLDDPYTKYFPDYPYAGVTLRHLLTHTGGMPDFDVEELVAPVLHGEKRIPECREIIDLIRKTGEGPAAAPGETFCYSDVGYMLLANAVEKAAGVPFEDFMRKHVFEPAGMTNSRILHTRRDGFSSDRIARNMVLENDVYVPSDLAERSAAYVVGSDGMNGCDYLYTTIFDMFAWDRALHDETVLTRAEQQIMFTPGKLNDGTAAGADEDEDGYGFGWFVKNDRDCGLIVGHSGGMPGLSTWFERFVDRDRVLIFLCCRERTDARAYWGFEEALEAVARDKKPAPIKCLDDLVVKDPDRSKWAGFCGKYEHPEDAEFIIDEVFLKNGELYANAMDDDGDELSFRLYPIGKDEFGRKGGLLDVTFGDGCLSFDGMTCKKIR